jgi:hypothetical protein
MNRLISLVCASLLLPAIAAAQPKTADDFYKDGETKYNLGDFPGAVEAFKKGFELEPSESKKAAYLFNVAQAYRMAKDCTQAQFFYKRYLALKDNDTKKPLKPEKRQEIEDRIKELDDCAKQQEAIKNKPPDKDPDAQKPPTGTPPGGTGTQVAVVGTGGGEEEGGGVTKTTAVESPRVISVRAFGGGAKLSTGDLDVPVQATFGLIAGYPIAVSDKLILDVGAGFTFTPVPYETGGSSKSGKLMAAFANVGATFMATPKIGLRGDLGIGGLFFSGIAMSPFTNGMDTTGALSMLHVRVGVSADYLVTPNVIVSLMPIAFSYSPAHDGLRDDIKSITAIDFMVGLGYRM